MRQDYLDRIGYLNGLQRIYKDIKDAEKRRENILEFTNYMGSFEASRGGGVHSCRIHGILFADGRQ